MSQPEYIATAAQALLDSETFKLAVGGLKDEAVENWKRTATEDTIGREQLYYLQLALSLVEERLRSMADSVKIDAAKAKKPQQHDEGEE